MTGDQSKDSLHDAIIGRRLKVSGYAFGVVAVCVWLYGFSHIQNPDYLEASAKEGFFFFAALGFVAAFLVFKGEQYLTRSESAERLLDSRPPVVLLRPFETDATELGRIKSDSFELGWEFFKSKYFDEIHIAEAVHPLGPLVAVADPGKALPPPGAARFRESDQTWKDRVVDLLRRARLVILVPGTSEALLWETTTAFRELKPQQLLILGLGTDTPREYEALSKMFKKATGEEFPDSQYLERAERTGITFDGRWTPRILRIRAPYWRTLLGARGVVDLHYGLKPVYRANGIAWHPSRVSKDEVWGIVLWLICLGAIFGPGGPRWN